MVSSFDNAIQLIYDCPQLGETKETHMFGMFGIASKPSVKSENSQFQDTSRQAKFEVIKKDVRHYLEDTSRSIDKNDVLIYFKRALTLKPIEANNSVARACQTLAQIMSDACLSMSDTARGKALLEALLEINNAPTTHKTSDGRDLGSLKNRLFIDEASVTLISQKIEALSITATTGLKEGGVPVQKTSIAASLAHRGLPTLSDSTAKDRNISATGTTAAQGLSGDLQIATPLPSAPLPKKPPLLRREDKIEVDTEEKQSLKKGGTPEAADNRKVGGIPLQTPGYPITTSSSLKEGGIPITEDVHYDTEEEKYDSSADTSRAGSPAQLTAKDGTAPTIVSIVPEQQQGIGSGKNSVLKSLTEGHDSDIVARKQAALDTIKGEPKDKGTTEYETQIP
jgi:hypothetical protein